MSRKNRSRRPKRPSTPPKAHAPRRPQAPPSPLGLPAPAIVRPAPRVRNEIVFAWRDIELRAVGTTAFLLLMLLAALVALALKERSLVLHA